MGKIGMLDWVKWFFQLFYVGIPYGWNWFLTFPLGLIVAYTAAPAESPYGEERTEHSEKYKAAGSSGWWEFWASPIKWLQRWNNYEDGLLGESSGKHSARVGGKEREFWNIYDWIIRNPFNVGKRTDPFYACFVNDCTLIFTGTGDVSDGEDVKEGWYLCKATHKVTGKVYYGYRYLKLWKRVAWLDSAWVQKIPYLRGFNNWIDGKVLNAVAGFKLKPSHANEVQDKDDLDKAFTIRVSPVSNRG